MKPSHLHLCTSRTQTATVGTMSVPVTTRLDEATVEALDRAVAAGLAPNRGAVVSQAVRAWLAHHSEEAIAESYRRRYAERPDGQEAEPGLELITAMGAFSASACLAADQT